MTGESEYTRAWLVPLADLSLILFVVTAVALVTSGELGSIQPVRQDQTRSVALGVASQVYVDTPDAPPIENWLADHPRGLGEQLTILAGYTDAGDRDFQLERGEVLAQKAMAQGFAPRIVIEQAMQPGIVVYFAQDQDPALARNLR